MMSYTTLVEEALASSNGDRKLAREFILERADEDPELSDELLRLGADHLIQSHATSVRNQVDANPRHFPSTVPKWDHKKQLKESLGRSGVDLFWKRMSYQLWGGLNLRDATRPHLLVSAAEREKIAGTHTMRAAWERKIAELLPNDLVTVAKAIKPDRLPERPSKEVQPNP